MSDFNLDGCIERIYNSEILSEEEIKRAAEIAKSLFLNESNIVFINAPVTIVGDIHGQFHDLIEMFRICGQSPYTNYLFLGDFVDRGYYSVECITLLMLLKIKYPKRITMIRGNHESRQVTQVYGFHEEVVRKYGSSNVWKIFTDMFDYLPLASVVDNAILGIHGGLSPSIETLENIKSIERFQETPHDGAAADILWSDPEVRVGWGKSPRGAGYTWGQDVTDRFLKNNSLVLICRGHQLVLDGFQWHHDKQCVTLFSAPNYCCRSGNKGAIMSVDDNLGYTFTQYTNVPLKNGVSLTTSIPDYFL